MPDAPKTTAASSNSPPNLAAGTAAAETAPAATGTTAGTATAVPLPSDTAAAGTAAAETAPAATGTTSGTATAVPLPSDPAAAGTAAAETAPAATGAATGTPANDDSLVAFLNPGAVPLVIAVLVGAVVSVRVVTRLLGRLSEGMVQRRLLIKQVSTFAGFAIYLVAAVVAATSLFNLSSQALFALSGSLAVIAGFAFKDFAASVLASLTILVTRPFQVGDRISFGDYYGEVIDIGLRSVQLVTLDDNLVTIPSSKVLTDAVANANAGALDCMVVIPFYLSPAADAARAKEIIHDALLASRFLYLGKGFVVVSSTELVSALGVVVKLNAKAYVYDARHEKAFAGDVTEMVLTQFQAEGIEMPHSAASVTPAAAP